MRERLGSRVSKRATRQTGDDTDDDDDDDGDDEEEEKLTNDVQERCLFRPLDQVARGHRYQTRDGGRARGRPCWSRA